MKLNLIGQTRWRIACAKNMRTGAWLASFHAILRTEAEDSMVELV